jgi:hypothetical protein
MKKTIKIEQGLQDRKKKPICFSYRERITIKISVPGIHRIHMFLGLPYPNPLVRGMDPDLDPHPSITEQKKKEKP